MPNCPVDGWLVVNPVPPSFDRMIVLVFSLAWTTAVCVLTVFPFIWLKPNYSRTRIRTATAPIAVAAAFVFIVAAQTIPFFVGLDVFPCALTAVMTLSPLCFMTLAQLVRNSNFILLYQLGQLLYEHGDVVLKHTSDELLNALPDVLIVGEPVVRVEHEKILRIHGGQSIQLLWYCFQIIRASEEINKARIKDSTKANVFYALRAVKFVLSAYGIFWLCVIAFVPWLILTIIVVVAVPQYRNGCTGCLPYSWFLGTLFGIGNLIILISSTYFVKRSRYMTDRWGMFVEGRLTSIVALPPQIAVFLLMFVQPALGDSTAFSFIIIVALGSTVVMLLLTAFPIYQSLRYEDGRREQRRNIEQVLNRPSFESLFSGIESPSFSISSDGLPPHVSADAEVVVVLDTSNMLNDLPKCNKLKKALANPETARGFELWLSQEFAAENLLFLRATSFWKANFHVMDATKRTSRASEIVNTFVLSGALMELNLSYNPAQVLLSCLQIGEFPSTTFDAARAEIASMLQDGALYRFSEHNRLLNLPDAVVDAVVLV